MYQAVNEAMSLDAVRRDQLIEDLARRLRQWGLSSPGIAFLEINRPFSYIGSQFLLFVQPLLAGFIDAKLTGEYVSLLEDRDNMRRLIERLELHQDGPEHGFRG